MQHACPPSRFTGLSLAAWLSGGVPDGVRVLLVFPGADAMVEHPQEGRSG